MSFCLSRTLKLARQRIAVRRISSLGSLLGMLIPMAAGWAQTTPVPVKVGYPAISAIHMPLWVMKDLGSDRKYGLAMEVVLVRGGAQNVQSLLAGSTQFAQVGGDVVVGSALKGAEVVAVAASMNRHVFSLVASPTIKSPMELKGKKVGILGFGGMSHWVTRLAIEALGLESKDVVFFPVGNPAARLASLEKGFIAATIQTYPELIPLLKSGYRVLLDAGGIQAYFPTSTIVVRRDFLLKNREVVKNFLRGYSETMRNIRTNRVAVTGVLDKYMKIADRDALAQTYDFFVRIIETIPRPNLIGIENVLKELAASENIGKARAEDFVDMSLLDELEREGFFKK